MVGLVGFMKKVKLKEKWVVSQQRVFQTKGDACAKALWQVHLRNKRTSVAMGGEGE